MTDMRSSLRGSSDETWKRGCGRAPAPDDLLRRFLAAGVEAPRNSARCPWGRRIPATVAWRLTTPARPRQRVRPSWLQLRLRPKISRSFKGSSSSATPHRLQGSENEGDRGGRCWHIFQTTRNFILSWVNCWGCGRGDDNQKLWLIARANSRLFPISSFQLWNLKFRDTLRVLCERCEDVGDVMFLLRHYFDNSPV